MLIEAFLFATTVAGPMVDGPFRAPVIVVDDRIITTPQGYRCIASEHEPLRREKLPGAPVMSNRVDDPLHDHYPHCSEQLLREHQRPSGGGRS